ncbi:MAG: hypothetical protein KDH91_17320, partial [Rhodoferax sp.]|nr:hypothetical protein [Rhodoferax sp.]
TDHDEQQAREKVFLTFDPHANAPLVLKPSAIVSSVWRRGDVDTTYWRMWITRTRGRAGRGRGALLQRWGCRQDFGH